MVKLAIVIPFYNVKNYTDELLNVLDPQVRDRDDVEVVVIDDGSTVPYETSFSWCKVYRKDNGGAATARNMGMDKTSGEYLSFIDADDLVPDYFVERLIRCIDEEHPDVIEFSWKSLNGEGSQHNVRLRSLNDRLHNPSVCTRAFRRAFLGDNRFNEKKDCTEDEDYSRKVGYLRTDIQMKRAIIPEYMYFYRTAVSNSKFKRFKKGIQKTKRIVYHYDHVTADMNWLLEEIKKEDEIHEIWLVTRKCDIPEMQRYARVSNEASLWGHELRGEPYPGFQLIIPPQNVDIVFYCESIHGICGILTFIYNTCQLLKRKYSIIVVYDRFDANAIKKLSAIVPVVKADANTEIYCNTLVLNRLTDTIPINIFYKKTVQMCHSCKIPNMRIPTGRDFLVNVSQAAQDSWNGEAAGGIVIHNMAYPEPKKTLFLISATRTRAADKGQADYRMVRLAEKMNAANIPFVWLVFSDKGLDNPPKNVVNMPPQDNIQGFIEKCDYLVQLSDQEACSMSILEALSLGTAIICTDFPSAREQGVVDLVNGYILPMDLNIDVKKFLKIPPSKHTVDNTESLKKWDEIIAAPAEQSMSKEVELQVVVSKYYDMELKRDLFRGYRYSVPRDRAKILIEKGVARRV